MSNARGEKDYVSLVNGLITEASSLSFPENSTADELNFRLDLNGLIRTRRKGFEELVSDFTQLHGGSSSVVFEEALYWNAPDLILLIYRETAPSAKTVLLIHRNDVNYTFVDSYEISGENTTIQLDDLTNFVLIVNGEKPTLLEYDESANEILIYSVDVFVRDFELVDDGLQISGRPTSLSDEHEYNLYNAGWYALRRLESTGEPGDPVQEFAADSASRSISATFVAPSTIEGIDDLSLASLSNGDAISVSGSASNNGGYTVDSTEIYSSAPQLVRIFVQENTIVNEPSVSIQLTVPQQYPSNADIAQLGLKDDGAGNEVFSNDTVNETILGNSEAPRGHYVYNINNFDREARRTSKSTDGTVDSTLTLEQTVSL